MSKTWEAFAHSSEPEANARNQLCLIQIKHFKWRKGRGKFRNNLFLLSLHICLTVPLKLGVFVFTCGKGCLSSIGKSSGCIRTGSASKLSYSTLSNDTELFDPL